jgi:hypothetical protein
LPQNPFVDKTILIAEDEFLIATDMEQICLDAGAARVIIVPDLGALDPNASYHAAILDLAIGGGSTTEFAAELMARGKPFVFTTGAVDLQSLSSDFPGVPVIGKPIAGPDLVEALGSAIRISGAGCEPE